ncbi:hypothetical protein ANOM_002287 [Aspergillus nomiae NRRL 13137]|uniref:Uncharacterized protein n=1 Tax=Aspergillus nomiae NRRL (strain ATCC 15546 / NRRL 13137 / CBS 260.88 / M93) TaxID=1509407 RepID=A0A0L1JD31_ASPN3|nr:uncharacterized protein ANOM_002287 [Aspergillus nomiae NRRL 13137]KNG89689.1 hypothetical protein ANOM_002287 [Aspergillus nomiae NRRL 13137]
MPESLFHMAYNITGANPKFLDPTQRAKTGDFRDAFAREASRRRNEARTSKGPVLNGRKVRTKSYNERKRFSWIPHFRRTTGDEERPRDKLNKQFDEDFLARIHHIYSCWLKKHIDAEKCGFCDAETGEILTAGSWPSVLYKARACGTCITVMVVLYTQLMVSPGLNQETEPYFIEPDTDTRTWVKVSKRFMDVETLEAFNLPWAEDTKDSTMLIIKTYLDVDFTEVLFEHTRRSRRMRLEDEVRELPENDREDGKSVNQSGPAWHWPGCYEKDPADELRRAEGEMFWTPNPFLLDGLFSEIDNYESPDSTHDASGASTKSPSCLRIAELKQLSRRTYRGH